MIGVRTAREGERCEVLCHLLDPGSAAAISLMDSGRLDPEGLIVAVIGEEIVGGVFLQIPPGGTPLLGAPWAIESGFSILWDLIAAATNKLDLLSPRYALSFSTVVEREERQHLLTPHGWEYLTELRILARSISAEDRYFEGSQLQFLPFDLVPASVRESVLSASYVGSHDCPELDRVRTAADVLAIPTTEAERSLWRIAFLGTDPAGILILNSVDERTLELSYLGVASPLRRKGYGEQILRYAIFLASEAGSDFFRLGVDVRNASAGRLYEKLGFREIESRSVFWWRRRS